MMQWIKWQHSVKVRLIEERIVLHHSTLETCFREDGNEEKLQSAFSFVFGIWLWIFQFVCLPFQSLEDIFDVSRERERKRSQLKRKCLLWFSDTRTLNIYWAIQTKSILLINESGESVSFLFLQKQWRCCQEKRISSSSYGSHIKWKIESRESSSIFYVSSLFFFVSLSVEKSSSYITSEDNS